LRTLALAESSRICGTGSLPLGKWELLGFRLGEWELLRSQKIFLADRNKILALATMERAAVRLLLALMLFDAFGARHALKAGDLKPADTLT
jgi:hypothetical protein